MPRFVVFIIFILVVYLSESFSGGGIGVSSNCINGECLIQASSSIISILLSIILALFIWYFPRKNFTIISSNNVGLWRRFGAFFLDFSSVLFIAVPILAMPLLISESSFTGKFEWAFVREFSRPTDNIYLLPAVLLSFIAIFLYFFYFSVSSKQSLGQYVLNYVVTPVESSESKPRHARRVLFSFLGLCMWPITVILALNSPTKACWWDTMTNTKLVKVKYS